MKSLAGSVLNPILDFLYPPVCFTCNTRLQDDEQLICTACWQSFDPVDPFDDAWRTMAAKLQAGGSVTGMVSCFLFEKDNRLQDVIHLLKYKGMKSLGVKLGREIGFRIRQEFPSRHFDYILPVPLHRVRRRERGYNQAEIISRGIAMVISAPVDTRFLFRKKYTPSQTQLDIPRREENVADAFRIHPKRAALLDGTTVLIVDDVMTTGSTISACAKILKESGVCRIYAASVALAQ